MALSILLFVHIIVVDLESFNLRVFMSFKYFLDVMEEEIQKLVQRVEYISGKV